MCACLCVHSLLAMWFPVFGGVFINLTTASFTLIPSNGVKILGWLVCKAVAYGLVNLFSKIACYGTNNDFESLLVVFSMV